MDKRTIANLAVKRSLTEALFSLLEKKGLGSVGISEIVAKAGVSRSSFYRNFDSTDDVLAYGNKLLEEEYWDGNPYETVDFTDAGCVAWQLRYWRAHAAMLITLSHSGQAHATMDKIFEISMLGEDDDSDEALSTRRFAAGAFFAIALDWIERGAPGNEEELARQFCETLSSGIS